MTITNIITFRQYDPNYGRIIIEVRAADIILENNGQFYKLMSGNLPIPLVGLLLKV